jgi:hypothetical protein
MKPYLIVFLESLSLALVLLINFLANYIPLGGRLTGQVSASFPTLFTPDGLTFSIWGLIYTFLLVYVVRKWWKIYSGTSVPVGHWYIIAAICNVGWLFAWHYELLLLSLLLMLVLLTSLWYWLRSLTAFELKGGDVYWYRVFVRVYFAWITVATVANIAIVGVSFGGLPFPAYWTFAVLFLVSIGALYRLFMLRDISFLLVICWALAGIYRNRSIETDSDASVIGYSALAFGIVLFLSLLFYFLKFRSNLNTQPK